MLRGRLAVATVERVREPDNLCRIPVPISIDGKDTPSYTTLLRPCAYGVMLDTKIVSRELHFHLNSDYLGEPDGTAHSTHFSDAPGLVPIQTQWRTVDHDAGELDVRWQPSGCLYDHLHRLIDLLGRLGHAARIDVSDHALAPFDALARGSTVAAARPAPTPVQPDLATALGAWGIFGPSDQGNTQA
jgi:hypothetical protein